LHELGIVDTLILLLRKIKEATIQRNLSIACARLCQYPPARQRVKDLQGIELLYSLGDKIVPGTSEAVFSRANTAAAPGMNQVAKVLKL
jgi:hypothetical protein